MLLQCTSSSSHKSGPGRDRAPGESEVQPVHHRMDRTMMSLRCSVGLGSGEGGYPWICLRRPSLTHRQTGHAERCGPLSTWTSSVLLSEWCPEKQRGFYWQTLWENLDRWCPSVSPWINASGFNRMNLSSLTGYIRLTSNPYLIQLPWLIIDWFLIFIDFLKVIKELTHHLQKKNIILGPKNVKSWCPTWYLAQMASPLSPIKLWGIWSQCTFNKYVALAWFICAMSLN